MKLLKNVEETVLDFLLEANNNFEKDLMNWVFMDAMLQMSKNGGNPSVFLKDEIAGSMHIYNYRNQLQGDILFESVEHDRLDILDELLKLRQSRGDFGAYLSLILWNIMNKGYNNPDYDLKLAKVLLEDNIDAIKNSRYGKDQNLPLDLLGGAVYRDTNPHLRSLVEFMVDLFKKHGVDIKADQALELAKDAGNSDYNDYFIKNLTS